MNDINVLIQGAIDMHVHANPDISLKHRQTKSNDEVIETCMKAGMKGLVLKTHGWPCLGLAHELNQKYENFTVYPSVSLNRVAGGPYPWVVEMAIQMGAKVIWLPTWSAKSDMAHTGFGTIAKEYLPLTKELDEDKYYYLLEDNGQLKKDIKTIIEMCAKNKIVICTGHISQKESIEVAKYANQIGYHKLVLTHPCSECSYNSFEQIQEFASYGHFVEFCTLNLAPLHHSLEIMDIKKIIENIGAEHCILSTDHFFDWTPSIPDSFYEVLGCLLDVGVKYDDLKTMMNNPHRLLEE